MSIVKQTTIDSWFEKQTIEQSNQFTRDLESGGVIALPHLSFALKVDELKFLSPHWSDGRAKNISLQPKENQILFKGAQGSVDELAQLQMMLERYGNYAESLVTNLFPAYKVYLKRANTSFRPLQVDKRASSYRKDDSRLHVDSFPSNPTLGTRLLRVFSNVNPVGEARVWRVGEPFVDMVTQFLPQTKAMWPLQSELMYALRITKNRRTEYDHRMLQMHDLLKADLEYQKNAPQEEVRFAPNTTWIVFSDQVLHAAMSGQFMFEQTFYVPVEALVHPAQSPLSILERKLASKLI